MHNFRLCIHITYRKFLTNSRIFLGIVSLDLELKIDLKKSITFDLLKKWSSPLVNK